MNEYPIVTTATLDATRLQSLATLSDEAFWDYARKLAHRMEQAAHPEEYLECRLHGGLRFLSLKALYAVVLPPHSIALLPATPPWMPGIVAWRGEVIAVIDLEAYLLARPTQFAQEGTLLIAHYEGLPIGLLVQNVGKIRHRGFEVDPVSPAEVEQDEPFAPSALLFADKGSEREANNAHEQWDESLIVDVPSVLADALQHIGTATRYE